MIRLICIDLDGVLVSAENFWLALHKEYGTLDEGIELTKKYLQSDYERLVQEVAGRLWKGKDAAPYFALAHNVSYQSGISELFVELNKFTQQNGERVQRVIISGGCYEVAQRIADEFGVEFIFANQLQTKDGLLTGGFYWPVGAGGPSKAKIIEQLCDDFDILPADVLMIGDSISDIDAFRIAGVSIAFNSLSKELKTAATYVVDSADLRDLLPKIAQLREGA